MVATFDRIQTETDGDLVARHDFLQRRRLPYLSTLLRVHCEIDYTKRILTGSCCTEIVIECIYSHCIRHSVQTSNVMSPPTRHGVYQPAQRVNNVNTGNWLCGLCAARLRCNSNFRLLMGCGGRRRRPMFGRRCDAQHSIGGFCFTKIICALRCDASKGGMLANGCFRLQLFINKFELVHLDVSSITAVNNILIHLALILSVGVDITHSVTNVERIDNSGAYILSFLFYSKVFCVQVC